MRKNSALICVCFCAGLIAAVVSEGTKWTFILLKLNEKVGVNFYSDFHFRALAPLLIWGGIWGLVFSLVVTGNRYRKHWVRKGIIISLLPTAHQLFYIYPQAGHGMLGVDLGMLTPLFVLLFNLMWGIYAGIFTRLLWGKS
ncbi:MAG: hypothetical protein C0615_01565 [Desulfuromonas sp.]|nr:MAG: hypothetical protein C0615_01565 [Desulfuromonas sp.]